MNIEWISVATKYPPDDAVVLVYHPEHGYYLAALDRSVWEDANTMATLPEGITHWAELMPPGEEN